MSYQFPEISAEFKRIQEIEELLSDYEVVSLKELNSLTFQERRDKKFLFHIDKLSGLLYELRGHYKVLEIHGKRLHQYHTVYYDTPDFRMYLDHHNDKLNRYKIRLRKYATTGSAFLEIKFKNNRNQTLKKRTSVSENGFSMNKKDLFFIEYNSPYTLSGLQESLKNTFLRITLADKQMTQRLTIDIGLTFSGNDHADAFKFLVIAELKQLSPRSAGLIFDVFHKLKIYPQRFSKYCIGQALINHSVKNNLIKPQLQIISKICKPEFDKTK